jgi:hypothetical protein
LKRFIMSTVVLERLTKYDYLPECSSLAKEYGTQAWDDRPEVAAIRMAVFAAMDTLDDETGIGARFDGRKVLVKPNLVTVYDHFGTMAPVSPETTDPRVLDALVLWLSRKAKEIVIVESSGRGNPTRAASTGLRGIGDADCSRLRRRRSTATTCRRQASSARSWYPESSPR